MTRTREAGITLVEVMVAAMMLVLVALSSFGAITHSNQILQQDAAAENAANIERVAESYLRSLDFGVLSRATESTLTSAIASQLSPADWAGLGATGSVQVTRLTLGNRLVTVDLRVTYAASRVASTSVRVAERGINP